MVYETATAGVTIQSPQLDINTVAAGGGSCLVFRNGLFNTGPESAGAQPGPTCYRYFSLGYGRQILIVSQEGWPTGRYGRESAPRSINHRLLSQDFRQIRKGAAGSRGHCDRLRETLKGDKP